MCVRNPRLCLHRLECAELNVKIGLICLQYHNPEIYRIFQLAVIKRAEVKLNDKISESGLIYLQLATKCKQFSSRLCII